MLIKFKVKQNCYLNHKNLKKDEIILAESAMGLKLRSLLEPLENETDNEKINGKKKKITGRIYRNKMIKNGAKPVRNKENGK